MRKLAIAMALTSTAIASPALARNDAWYIGLEGGPSIVEDISFDVGATSNAIIVDSDTGTISTASSVMTLAGSALSRKLATRRQVQIR